jgi:hypothetical protein
MHSGVQVVHVAHNVGKAVMRKTSLMQACPRCPQSERNEDRLGCVLLGTEVVTAHIAQEPGDKAEPPAPPALERNDQQVSRPGGKADDLTMRSDLCYSQPTRLRIARWRWRWPDVACCEPYLSRPISVVGLNARLH